MMLKTLFNRRRPNDDRQPWFASDSCQSHSYDAIYEDFDLDKYDSWPYDEDDDDDILNDDY